MNNVSFKGFQSNTVSVSSAPIKSATIESGLFGIKPFDKAMELFQPGDIFSYQSSSVSVRDLHSGMYLVNTKDKVNNGVTLTQIDSDSAEIIRMGGVLYTPYDTKGNCKIIGRLNVSA